MDLSVKPILSSPSQKFHELNEKQANITVGVTLRVPQAVGSAVVDVVEVEVGVVTGTGLGVAGAGVVVDGAGVVVGGAGVGVDGACVVVVDLVDVTEVVEVLRGVGDTLGDTVVRTGPFIASLIVLMRMKGVP